MTLPIMLIGRGAAVVVLTNWALASNGATVTASSTVNASFPASSVIDGFRYTHHGATDWASGGGWNSNTNSSEWLEIAFNATRSISEIDVFTLADAVSYTTDPTSSDTCTVYGILDFVVEYWNGAAWVNISTVTANTLVWRKFTFSAVSTTKIRTSGMTGRASYCRMVEIEAWG